MTPHETGLTVTPGDSRATVPLTRTFGPQGPTLGDLSDAYLQDYQVRQFRSQSTARGRTAHLAAFFGRDARAATLTTYQIRQYQLTRRAAGAATGTINRETSALHRMGTLAVHWGWLETVPGFPDRLRENPPRQGFFEHPEYLAVRAHLPAPWQDILDLAYYSGWRKNELLGLTWDEIDEAGGVIRLSPARSKTLVGRILPISPPIADALNRRRARRDPESPLVFHRDGITIRRWRTAWRTACQAAGVPTRFLHDCRRTAARNLIRANVPERVAMLLTGHKSRAIFDRYNIIHEQELLDAGDQLVAYLAQQAQAGPAPPAASPGRSRRPAHRITPPPRTTRHCVRAHGPPAPARGRGRQWPDTARLGAAAHARATETTRPAIVAHAATGRADAAEHEHAPGPAAGACRKAGCHSPAQGHTRPRGVAERAPPAASCPAGERTRQPDRPGNGRRGRRVVAARDPVEHAAQQHVVHRAVAMQRLIGPERNLAAREATNPGHTNRTRWPARPGGRVPMILVPHECDRQPVPGVALAVSEDSVVLVLAVRAHPRAVVLLVIERDQQRSSGYLQRSRLRRCPGRRQRPRRAGAAGHRIRARWRSYRTQTWGPPASRASVWRRSSRWPVSSPFNTGWSANACCRSS